MKKQEKKIVTYKGFNPDMTCRGFSYELGKTYEHDGDVAACSGGFHACEMPLGVLKHYKASKAVFAICEQWGDVSKDGESDTKLASRFIHVKPAFIFFDSYKLSS